MTTTGQIEILPTGSGFFTVVSGDGRLLGTGRLTSDRVRLRRKIETSTVPADHGLGWSYATRTVDVTLPLHSAALSLALETIVSWAA